MTTLRIARETIKKIDIVHVDGGLTATQAYAKYRPDYMINLALFDMKTSKNIVFLEDENKKSGYLFADHGIGIHGEKELLWCTHKDAYANSAIRDFVSGAPTLVSDGKKDISWGNKSDSSLNTKYGKHLRAIVGFNKNELVLCCTDKTMTIDETANTALNLSMQYAINVDGGGSCHLQEGSKIHKKSTRKIPSWLFVYLHKEQENKPMPKVCLDPGHAKNTAGKRSPDSSLMEYDFNRKVTYRMEHHLKRHGVDVVLTCRDEVTDKSLSARAKVANDAKADIFVSVHGNAAGDGWSSANGWEIFVYKKGGNAEKLAKLIQAESVPYLGLRFRRLDEANFGVLRETNMPAVLIEQGFYSNKQECDMMKTKAFQEKCAIANTKAILKYFNMQYKEEVNEPVEQKPATPPPSVSTNGASSWASEAWNWAQHEAKICDGARPKDVMTREEAMVFLYRFDKYISSKQ